MFHNCTGLIFMSPVQKFDKKKKKRAWQSWQIDGTGDATLQQLYIYG